MKRWFYFICFAATVLAILAGSFTARVVIASAAEVRPLTGQEAAITHGPGNPLAGFDQAGITRPRDLRQTISMLIRVALGFVGIILLVLTIYAGLLWFSARGNEDQVTKAKAILRNSVIGLVIIMLSYSMTLFVFRSVFAPPQTNPSGTGTGAFDFDEIPGDVKNAVPNLNKDTDITAPYQFQRSR